MSVAVTAGIRHYEYVEPGFHIDTLMKKYHHIVKISCWIVGLLILLNTLSHAGDVDVTNFGAKGDGLTLNTMAIQKAIDACNAGGGGKVIFPKGIYLSGTIELKDNVTLYLEREAKLLGSTEIENYRNVDPFTEGLGIDVGWALVVAVDRKNIGIEGAGVIDGQGAKLKAAHILKDTRPEGQRWGRRPFLLRVVRCNGVRVKDIRLNYAAAWTSHYFQSRNILIENVKIVSVGVAHNDGIGIDGSQDVVIRNCDVESGDDALVFKTTSSRMACKNIEVSDMRLKSNQGGIKMGTESMANFENITIRNCLIYDTKNGGVKLLSVDGAQIKNILISDINMKNIRTPILLRLGSRLSVFRKGQDTKQSTGRFENVVLRNIHAISADSTQLKSASGILITGVPDHKLSGVTLENIRIELPGGGDANEVSAVVPEAIDRYPEVKTFGPVIPAYGLWARHVEDLNVWDLVVRLRKSDFRPAIVLEDVTQMNLTGAVVPGNNKASAVIDVRRSKDILIDRCKVAGTAKQFVNADAISKHGIRLDNNILPRGVMKINK